VIRFDGRVAIVSGAGRGLGRAYAISFAARGAKVVVNDVAGAEETAGTIAAAGGTAIPSVDSVMTPQGAANIARAALEAFGQIDVVVNNAGFLRDRSFEKMSIEEIDAVIGVHVLGPMYLTHAAWPAMKARRYGRVIMVSSTSGLYGNFGQANYGAAKLAVVGLMNALKEEGARYGILVNAIAPLAQTLAAGETFDVSAREAMRLDWIVALVDYLASEACTATGRLIHAGAGRYSRARIAESEGITFPVDSPIDAETIERRFAEIDGPPVKTFANSAEAVLDKGIKPARTAPA
jgi:NAD(P)-dependent dehydrogenase (short-subunit alcohol dehydrogenase family)